MASRKVYRLTVGLVLCITLLTRAQGNHLGTFQENSQKKSSYAQTVTLRVPKWHLLTSKCCRLSIGTFFLDYFLEKFLNGSLEPVLAGLCIKLTLL